MTIKLCLDHKTTPVWTDVYKNEVLFLFVVPDCLLSKVTAKLLLLRQRSNYDSDNPPPNTQRNKNLPNSNRCQQHLQFNLSWETMLCHMTEHQKKLNATFYSTVLDVTANREIYCFIIFLMLNSSPMSFYQWGSNGPKEE